MEIKEIRIGNCLQYKNTKDIAIVELIHKKHFDCRDEYGSFTANGNYQPIPLTEEWLLKFGFEFRDTNKQYGWYLEVSINRVLTWCHSKEINLEFDLEDYNYNNTLFDFNCQYVHQLQNLYFALTNEELTWKSKEN
jgi:hypothetical protein